MSRQSRLIELAEDCEAKAERFDRDAAEYDAAGYRRTEYGDHYRRLAILERQTAREYRSQA